MRELKRVILKLSGEALSGSKGQGYDDELIEDIARQVKAVGDVAKIGKVQKDVKIIQKAVSTVKYTRRNFRKNLAKMVGFAFKISFAFFKTESGSLLAGKEPSS